MRIIRIWKKSQKKSNPFELLIKIGSSQNLTKVILTDLLEIVGGESLDFPVKIKKNIWGQIAAIPPPNFS